MFAVIVHIYTHKMTALKPLWKDFTYFAHQPAAIEWMMRQESEGVNINGNTVYGGLLGDEMGLGKTIEVAGLIKNRPVGRTLILGPLAVIPTWASVLERSGVTVWTIKKGLWVCGKVRPGPQCFVTNMEKAAKLEGCAYDRIIVDEAHRIRNPKTALARTLAKVSAKYRWALTATPIVNKMEDVLALYKFIGVDLEARLKWKSHMYEWTPKLVFHRSLDELRVTLPDAPPKPRIHTISCPFASEEEEEFYHGIQGAIVDKLKVYKRDIRSNAAIFKLLLRLRQISVHPQIYINAMKREMTAAGRRYRRPDWKGVTTKFQAIADILADTSRKTIIVAHFNDEILLLNQFITEHELAKSVFMYNGSMDSADREEEVAAAQAAGEGAVMLLQLQAGGVGINLQTFDRVIFMNPWWNAALVDQAIGRAVRMGQTKVVDVYHILFEEEHAGFNSIIIDAMMNEKVEAKRELLTKFWDLA